jgi:hypothetical protein
MVNQFFYDESGDIEADEIGTSHYRPEWSDLVLDVKILSCY